ncbi:NAD(P)/FAD-dependent oxidoreductase [Flavisolibacter ginsenosidimutans]|uniref:NAD(P)/FAD-dependent oxidoreductase n=1 Tax=Flavisolibacter ginsenosidimutans TaxID=661481 RepID=A0A5B8UFS3_9BACT|nr:NAD(P)/FAD-dependent oxidoreductase [Flavisolibacter ginsenosidimutans]QEC55527.1 NAD(P)/FAD-dependent oxidoreductase [Flavisolibacter ginsenosidimutans]
MHNNNFDVIIVGGSYSGLAAAMSLGRALRKVLVIDSGKPCNRQTPHSHNFLTQDGNTPNEIAALGKKQVLQYDTVTFVNGLVINGAETKDGFQIRTEAGSIYTAKKLIFATGIKDIMPDVPGLADCWGISVIHCPYCHGYEVQKQKTGILGNGHYGYEFSALISNWTADLTLYTNGKSTLTVEQAAKIHQYNVAIVEDEILHLEHTHGYVQHIIFKSGRKASLTALYTRLPFIQHCPVPRFLGCELNEDGYIKINPAYKTSVQGVFACGDNTTRLRSVANAVAAGTAAGMMVSKELIDEAF